MGKMHENYYEYLKSETWKEKRKELLEEAAWVCFLCGGKATQIHHLKYNNLGDEMLGEDAEAVCGNCHKEIHADKIMEYGGYNLGYGSYGEW